MLRALIPAVALLAAATLTKAADVIDLSPLVNERTMFVARVDVSKVNLPATFRWVRTTLEAAKVPNVLVQSMVGEMETASGRVLQPALNALTKAGVTQAALVVNATEQGFAGPSLAMLVIATADPDAVTNAIKPFPVSTVDLDGVTVWTAGEQAELVRQIVPSPRPDLLNAVVEPAGAVAVAGFGIPDAQRAELLKNVRGGRDPMGLPPALSPMSNVKSAAVRVETAAGPRVLITADTKSAEAVTNFFNGFKPDKDIGPAMAALPVTANGNVVTLDMKQPQFETLAAAVTPALERAKKAADRIRSMSNMRQLQLACQMYANENRGSAPASFDDLGKYLGGRQGVPPAVLTNPQRPELGAKGYIYVPLAEGKIQKLKGGATRLAIYEAGDLANGSNVAFWDGHVEFVRDRAKVEALIAAAKAAPAAAPAAP